MFISVELMAQNQYYLKGNVVEEWTKKPLQGAKLSIEESSFSAFSDQDGRYSIKTDSTKSFVLRCELEGYETYRMEMNRSDANRIILLDAINLRPLSNRHLIDELDDFSLGSNHLASVLKSSKNLVDRTAAYDFSQTFFRMRNLDAKQQTLMLNGIELNKVDTGRPEWSNWGGLNDALRQTNEYASLEASAMNLGGLSNSKDMISLASEKRKGIKISYAVSNRSYLNRAMITIHSGIGNKGWAYSFSSSFRLGKEGYRSGTPYKAYSFFLSIDKILNDRHKLNSTAIYAYNKRGKSASMTEEVFKMKSDKYNSFWGFQNGSKRNARTKEVLEPIIQINHHYKIDSSCDLHSQMTYQFGHTAHSRLDYGGVRWLEGSKSLVGGGANPDPTYYQKLPSYFLKDSGNPNYSGAYLAEQEFKNQGQIIWSDLYRENLENGASVYALYEDKKDQNSLMIQSRLHKEWNSIWNSDFTFSYQLYSSDNYARLSDLLGGNGYLDVDQYADDWNRAQSDLKNPNRIVKENDKFKYHYSLNVSKWSLNSQTRVLKRKFEMLSSFRVEKLACQRNGKFENGSYPGERSFGKSKALSFLSLALKAEFTYKFTGRHLLTFHGAYLEKNPALKDAFSNIRENNDLVLGLEKEKALGFDLGYLFRHPLFRINLGLYYLLTNDETKLSFYYTDGIMGGEEIPTSAFVQEVLNDIDKMHYGIEFGLEVSLLTSFKVRMVGMLGRATYSNNPQLYLTSDSFNSSLDMGQSHLKNYRVSNGPQQALSLGIEYSSSKYWWFGISYNFFDKAFVSVAPINRTNNFFLDSGGQPIDNADGLVARDLLKQEDLGAYSLINVVGGKSWKFKDFYFGIFLSANNITNTLFKTGGYEQSRNANYNTLLEDRSREKPLFGSKYWFGMRSAYFASIYLRL